MKPRPFPTFHTTASIIEPEKMFHLRCRYGRRICVRALRRQTREVQEPAPVMRVATSDRYPNRLPAEPCHGAFLIERLAGRADVDQVVDEAVDEIAVRRSECLFGRLLIDGSGRAEIRMRRG